MFNLVFDVTEGGRWGVCLFIVVVFVIVFVFLIFFVFYFDVTEGRICGVCLSLCLFIFPLSLFLMWQKEGDVVFVFLFVFFILIFFVFFICDRRREIWWYQILLCPQSPISPPACLEFNMKTPPHQPENKCLFKCLCLFHCFSLITLIALHLDPNDITLTLSYGGEFCWCATCSS